MKRITYYGLACSMALALMASFGVPGAHAAAPLPNSAVIKTRIFNDCSTSTLSTVNNYPASIVIGDDADNTCSGFANLHNWRFSANGADPIQYSNNDVFRFSADLVIDGPGQAESGIQISPWWSPDVEGRINVRTTDGEIALFGGVLPFYSFTANTGVEYVKGTPIHLELNYVPHSNTELDPATLEAKITYNGTFYSSGILNFTDCNPAEQPIYGCWGDLNLAEAGGHIQCLWFPGQNQEIHSTWTNIQYFADEKPTAAAGVSWGKVKTLYR